MESANIAGLSVEYEIDTVLAGESGKKIKSYTSAVPLVKTPDTGYISSDVIITVWLKSVDRILAAGCGRHTVG